jgi:GntR family transcriptional regulator, transcriptional repressor for pyruvate dehydrogenase complex
LYEDLADRLSQLVREAGMAAGERFPTERELARQLSVSRTSIRQAMVVLQALGFVDVRHGEGIFLRRTKGFGESLPKLLERRRRLPDVLEAREALETKLAELAAVRRDEDDLAAMAAALRTMKEEIRQGQIGNNGDAAFHHGIAVAARSSVLSHLMDEMAEAIEETRMESLSEPGRPPRSLEAHYQILAAIRQRSPELAAKTMRSHLQEVADVSLLRWRPTDSKDGDR